MILIFEDEPLVRALYSAVMTGFARQFSIFESPREYLGNPDAFAENIDCILSDNDMPGISGIEFLRQIRNGAHDHIPVCVPFTMITGSSNTAILQEAADLGADVVGKPLSVARLREIVALHPPLQRAPRLREQRNNRIARRV